jgi:hypothetical protein
MLDFFNWTSTTYVALSNWVWLLVAALIGVYIGWRSCDMTDNKN